MLKEVMFLMKYLRIQKTTSVILSMLIPVNSPRMPPLNIRILVDGGKEGKKVNIYQKPTFCRKS